jgi:hypothetical protein
MVLSLIVTPAVFFYMTRNRQAEIWTYVRDNYKASRLP